MCDPVLMRTGIEIQLSPEDRARLERLVADRNTPQKHVWRAQIVLLSGEGAGTMEITRRTGQSKPTVWRWQARFAAEGVAGLLRDKTRPPGRKPLAASVVQQVVTKTTTERPPDATHWTARAMARAVGIAVSSVQKIWQAHGLKPHLVRQFKLSNDPAFAEKLVDIVGLYMDPPDRALVLAVDEKSQIQALDRTQPLLPLRPGQVERRTHDYKRCGTTSLFAALDVKAGTVIGKCMPRHRAAEFRRFLNTVEANTPEDLDVHVVMDNASSHKTTLIRNWFAKRPRWHAHYTPTSASWINQVERFFALLTDDAIRRSAHRSTDELETAITAYIDANNAEPKPFRWTKSADDILAAVQRFCRRTTDVQVNCSRTSEAGH